MSEVTQILLEIRGGNQQGAEQLLALVYTELKRIIKAIEIIPQAETATGAASSAAPIRIKAGLSTPFTDSGGQVWQPDTGFEGGMVSQVSGGGPPTDQGPLPNGPNQRPTTPNPEQRSPVNQQP